ncbi:MAG TPA: hypothetical protein VIU61_06880 [Kofleriaceae bacterium]
MADAVEVLRCKSCDAPIALGTGDTAKCSHCGTETEVPASHRALRAADAEEQAHRVEGAKLVRRFGTLPAMPLRALAWTWNVVFFVFVGLPVVVIVGALLGDRLLAAYGFFTKQHLHDVVLPSFSDPDAAPVALGYGVATVLFGLWIIAAVYGGRRNERLRALQAGLAAKPPERPGGSLQCRMCGAPLEVPPNALGATCLYCRAENLVAIPADWLAKAKQRASSLGKTIAEESKAYFEQIRALRRSMVFQLAVLAVIGGGLTALFFAIATSGTRPRMDHDWHREVANPILRRDARMAGGLVGRLSLDHQPVISRGTCPADGKNQPLRFGRGDCTASGCVVHFYVPLRAGDAVTLRGRTLPWKTLSAFYDHVDNRPFDKPDWGHRIGKPAWIGGDREATFHAGRDGWYMLWIAALEGGVSIERYELCVRIDR